MCPWRIRPIRPPPSHFDRVSHDGVIALRLRGNAKRIIAAPDEGADEVILSVR